MNQFTPKQLYGDQCAILPDVALSDYLNRFAVSCSMLKEFADCPLSGYEYLTTRGRKPTAAMVLGSAVDCLVCEPDKFASRFVVRPAEVDGKPWHSNRTDCKLWLKEQTRTVLSGDEYHEAELCVRAIHNDARAQSILDGARAQQTVLWGDKRTGLQMMGRPDFILPRGAADLKVTNDASTDGFSRTIDNFKYHWQAAIYSDGIEANGRECNTFYFIAVQSGDRPKVNVRYLKSDALELGRIEYRHALRNLADCIERDVWPSYGGEGSEILQIDLPHYAYERGDVELEMNA